MYYLTCTKLFQNLCVCVIKNTILLYINQNCWKNRERFKLKLGQKFQEIASHLIDARGERSLGPSVRSLGPSWRKQSQERLNQIHFFDEPPGRQGMTAPGRSLLHGWEQDWERNIVTLELLRLLKQPYPWRRYSSGDLHPVQMILVAWNLVGYCLTMKKPPQRQRARP